MTSWQRAIWRQVFMSVGVTAFFIFSQNDSLREFFLIAVVAQCDSKLKSKVLTFLKKAFEHQPYHRLLWIYSCLLLPQKWASFFLSALKHDDLKECSVGAVSLQSLHVLTLIPLSSYSCLLFLHTAILICMLELFPDLSVGNVIRIIWTKSLWINIL